LSRNAVMRSVRPSAFAIRPVSEPDLTIELTTAVSALRPTTLTEQATVTLIHDLTKRWLMD
jgi:LysR family nitrogen assimilation transcriptional regulator